MGAHNDRHYPDSYDKQLTTFPFGAQTENKIFSTLVVCTFVTRTTILISESIGTLARVDPAQTERI